MAAEGSGWTETEEGFRFDVEGGYVVYLMGERALEIVARLEDDVSVAGQVTQTLAGQLAEQLSVEGEGRCYDDGWGGQNENTAREAAAADAQRRLKEEARQRVRQAQQNAEAPAAAELEAAARHRAEAELRRAAAERRAQLAAAARQRLNEVGLRCRQAFHAVLARAYRDAILAYARNHGAEGLQCTDNGETIEIEFLVER